MERRKALMSRLVAADLAAADLAAADPATRSDLLQTLQGFLDESRTAQLTARLAASDPTYPITFPGLPNPRTYDQQQRQTRAPPTPSIPANTADDYPQWAGTSYWSAPVESTPTPVKPAPAPAPAQAPEVPTASFSSSSTSAPTLNTLQYFAPTPRTTVRQALESTTQPSGSRVPRPISSTQDDATASAASAAGDTPSVHATDDAARAVAATFAQWWRLRMGS
jgi:hypothetical protein